MAGNALNTIEHALLQCLYEWGGGEQWVEQCTLRDHGYTYAGQTMPALARIGLVEEGTVGGERAWRFTPEGLKVWLATRHLNSEN